MRPMVTNMACAQVAQILCRQLLTQLMMTNRIANCCQGPRLTNRIWGTDANKREKALLREHFEELESASESGDSSDHASGSGSELDDSDENIPTGEAPVEVQGKLHQSCCKEQTDVPCCCISSVVAHLVLASLQLLRWVHHI